MTMVSFPGQHSLILTFLILITRGFANEFCIFLNVDLNDSQILVTNSDSRKVALKLSGVPDMGIPQKELLIEAKHSKVIEMPAGFTNIRLLANGTVSVAAVNLGG